MGFLDELDEVSGTKPAPKTGGPVEKGTYIGVVSGASVEDNEKFGPVVNLELTLQGGRKVWSAYYLTGDYAEQNVGRLKSQLFAANADLFSKGSEIPNSLETLKGRTVEAYVGIKKNDKNYFSINKEVDAALAESTLDALDPEPSFDSSEEIPF